MSSSRALRELSWASNTLASSRSSDEDRCFQIGDSYSLLARVPQAAGDEMEKAERPGRSHSAPLSPDARAPGAVVLREDRHDLSPGSFRPPLLPISLDVGKGVLSAASRVTDDETWRGHSPGTCPSATSGRLPALEVDLPAFPVLDPEARSGTGPGRGGLCHFCPLRPPCCWTARHPLLAAVGQLCAWKP